MSSLLGGRLVAAVIGAIVVLVTGGISFAQDFSNMSCDDLWEARNQIYAEEGFCFKTQAALREFGYRCYPPYGRLTRHEQAVVNDIQYWERRYGCN